MVDENKIQKEAKEILDRFALALSRVKVDERDFHFDREEFEREEGEGKECDFKKKLLENAPNKNDDFVIVEKGGWK